MNNQAWTPLYRLGAVAALLAALFFRRNIGAEVSLFPGVEATPQGLGGAGGELLGGVWILFVSWAALQTNVLPRALNWLGFVIAIAGLLSNVPVLRDAVIVFGLLQIVWFAWLGIVMLRPAASATALDRHESSEQGIPLLEK